MPTEEDWVTTVGVVSGTVAVELRQIPNQPIRFVVENSIFITYGSLFNFSI